MATPRCQQKSRHTSHMCPARAHPTHGDSRTGSHRALTWAGRHHVRREASKLTNKSQCTHLTPQGQAMAVTMHGSQKDVSCRATVKAGSQHVAQHKASDPPACQQQPQKFTVCLSSVQWLSQRIATAQAAGGHVASGEATLQPHQQEPNDVHIPPHHCAVAVQARGVQHVVHAVARQVLIHSSIRPGTSEAQQLALPCCDASVQVLQIGVLALLYLPCSRWPVSTVLQGQA